MRKTKIEADETKRQIYLSALDVFSEKGYDGASISDICKRANLTKGALYWHFLGKLDLYSKLINHIFTEIIDSSSKVKENAEHPLLFIRDFTKNFLSEVVDSEMYQTAFKLFVREFKMDNMSDITEMQKELEKEFDFEDYFRKVIEQGELPDTLSALQYSEMYKSFLDSIIVNWLYADKSFNLVEWGMQQFEYIFRLDLNKEKI